MGFRSFCGFVCGEHRSSRVSIFETPLNANSMSKNARSVRGWHIAVPVCAPTWMVVHTNTRTHTQKPHSLTGCSVSILVVGARAQCIFEEKNYARFGRTFGSIACQSARVTFIGKLDTEQRNWFEGIYIFGMLKCLLCVLLETINQEKTRWIFA